MQFKIFIGLAIMAYEQLGHAHAKCFGVFFILDPRALLFCAWRDREKSSGEPCAKLFRYLFLVETKKALLIGQSVTR